MRFNRLGILALCLVAMLAAAYASVFMAGGRRLDATIIIDGLANALALGAMALMVYQITRVLPWEFASRWWFVPAHTLLAVVTSLLSIVATATTLGVGAFVRDGAFRWVWLGGPGLYWQLFTAVFMYAAIAASGYALQVAHDARDAQRLRHDAQLAALRAQLDPHVLLNTLHSLVELVRGRDDGAEEAIDRFGRLVRYLTAHRSGTAELVTLADEWQSLEDYVHLEGIRLGSRLHASLTLDAAARSARIPALSLQPLVENAIRHGIAPRPGAAVLHVSAIRDRHAVRIVVRDDGLGANALPSEGSGRGLALVAARIQAHFGSAAAMRWGPYSPQGWEVCIDLPYTPAIRAAVA